MAGSSAIVSNKNVTYIGAEFLSSKGYIRKQSFAAPAAASATAVHAAINSNAVVTTGITNPDMPRVLSITGAGSGHSATGNIVINGTDIRGATISDTIALNSNTTVNGVKAFKTVTSIDATGVSGNDANNTWEVGISALLGLDRKMTDDGVIKANVDHAADSTIGTIHVDGTNVSGNTWSPATAPNASHNYVLFYISTELRKVTP